MKSSSWNGLDYKETFIANAQIAILLIRRYAVGDPYPGGAQSSRPWGKEGGSLQKIFFGPLGLSLI